MTDAPALLLRTPQQYEIAVAYSRGASMEAIAADLNANTQVVLSVVAAVGYDRGRAREAVLDYDRQRAAVAAAKGKFPPQPQRAMDLAPVPTQPREPEVVVTRRSDVPLTGPLSADELLSRAKGATVARVRTLADRIRRDVEELAAVLHRSEAEEAARALVARRRRELDEAEAKLREITGKPARQTQPAAAAAGPLPAVVRAWAKANGVSCNPHGRVPTSVVDAYLAATRGTS